MAKKILVFVSVIMVFIHTGCTSLDTIPDQITQNVGEDIDNRLEAINGTYTLSPPDAVNITVNDNPDLTTRTMIRPDGNITFPLLGDVYIEGLTPLEVREKTHKLLGRYLKELPLEAVNVMVTGFNSKNVYIYTLGSGIVPIPFTGDLTVLRAVAQSGILSSTTKRRGIKIMRPARDANEKPQKRVIDLDDLLKRGEIVDNIVLRPNDIVYIPPTLMGRVGYALQNIINPARGAGQAYSNYQFNALGFDYGAGQGGGGFGGGGFGGGGFGGGGFGGSGS
ncbi:MAG: polysaccharide biosynthesis/export family protein [Planctomycetota bacterium]